MDPLELTFIILGREDPPTTNLLMSEDIACLQMIGDVNLFIKESEEGEEGGQSHVAKEGEVEVMIAGMRQVSARFTLSSNEQNQRTDARALRMQHSLRSCITPLRVCCRPVWCW